MINKKFTFQVIDLSNIINQLDFNKNDWGLSELKFNFEGFENLEKNLIE